MVDNVFQFPFAEVEIWWKQESCTPDFLNVLELWDFGCDAAHNIRCSIIFKSSSFSNIKWIVASCIKQESGNEKGIHHSFMSLIQSILYVTNCFHQPFFFIFHVFED
jgi:hypothetical protein